MSTPEKIALVQRMLVQNTIAVHGFVVAILPDFTRVDDMVQETFQLHRRPKPRLHKALIHQYYYCDLNLSFATYLLSDRRFEQVICNGVQRLTEFFVGQREIDVLVLSKTWSRQNRYRLSLAHPSRFSGQRTG